MDIWLDYVPWYEHVSLNIHSVKCLITSFFVDILRIQFVGGGIVAGLVTCHSLQTNQISVQFISIPDTGTLKTPTISTTHMWNPLKEKEIPFAATKQIYCFISHWRTLIMSNSCPVPCLCCCVWMPSFLISSKCQLQNRRNHFVAIRTNVWSLNLSRQWLLLTFLLLVLPFRRSPPNKVYLFYSDFV